MFGIAAAVIFTQATNPAPANRPWYEQVTRTVVSDRPAAPLKHDDVAAIAQQRSEANRQASEAVARRRDRDAADRTARAAADREWLSHARQEAAAERASAEQRSATVRAQAERGAAELAGQIAASRQAATDAEADSAARFARGNEKFEQSLADRMSEIKAEQDRNREMAKQAVLAYFTGGASLVASPEAMSKNLSSKPSPNKGSSPADSRVTSKRPTTATDLSDPRNKVPNGSKAYDAPIGPQPLQPSTMNSGRNERWVGKLGGYVGSAIGGVLGGKAGKGTTGQIGSGIGGGVGSDAGQYVGEVIGRFLDRHADQLKKEYDPKSDPRFDLRSLFDR